MQKIKIVKIEVKEGDNDKGHWRNFIFTGEDKSKVNIFEPNNAGLKPSEVREGDTIEAEIELKGKYTNLTSFTVVEHSEVSKPVKEQQQGRTYGKSPETVAMEIDGKFRDTALMQACEYLKNDGHSTDKDVLTLADRFYAWLKGTPLKASPSAPESVTKPPKPAPSPVAPEGDKQPVREGGFIPFDWLTEKLGILRQKDAKVWGDANLLSYMKKLYKVDATDVFGAASKLTEPQAKHFTKHIEEAIAELEKK